MQVVTTTEVRSRRDSKQIEINLLKTITGLTQENDQLKQKVTNLYEIIGKLNYALRDATDRVAKFTNAAEETIVEDESISSPPQPLEEDAFDSIRKLRIEYNKANHKARDGITLRLKHRTDAERKWWNDQDNCVDKISAAKIVINTELKKKKNKTFSTIPKVTKPPSEKALQAWEDYRTKGAGTKAGITRRVNNDFSSRDRKWFWEQHQYSKAMEVFGQYTDSDKVNGYKMIHMKELWRQYESANQRMKGALTKRIHDEYTDIEIKWWDKQIRDARNGILSIENSEDDE